MTNTPAKAGRMQDGRFSPGQSGNPKGKRPGTRHRMTLAVQALLDGEAEAITRTAIEAAKAGDTTAMRLVLERVLPPRRELPITLPLPAVETPADILRAQSSILAAVSRGEITPSEGNALCAITEKVCQAIESADLEKRLKTLEEYMQESRHGK